MTTASETVTPIEREELPEGAVASLVCGIIGITIPVVGFVTGIIAIVLGNKARKQPNGGVGTAGFVLGVITTVLYSLIVIAGIYGAATAAPATGYSKVAVAHEVADQNTARRETNPLAELRTTRQLISG